MVMSWFLSFDKCSYCKLLRTKASAECPECKCNCKCKYWIRFMTDPDFTDLENDLLNWPASYVWFMPQFKWDQNIICPSTWSRCPLEGPRPRLCMDFCTATRFTPLPARTQKIHQNVRLDCSKRSSSFLLEFTHTLVLAALHCFPLCF